MEEFVKLNPQFKEIRLLCCPDIDGRIFHSIATHVPDIEAIHIDCISALNDSNLKYVGKLHSLSTLKLRVCNNKCMDEFVAADETLIPLILYEIRAANIPLQHLHLFCGMLLSNAKKWITLWTRS